MPYIKQEKRDVLDPSINELHKKLMELDDDNISGNLNYIITKLIRMCYGKSYKDINSAIGMLQCAMMEHYRTVAAPHENQAIYDNGDIDD